MAGTIPYLYDPQQDVFVIITCDEPSALAVRPARVIRVRAAVLSSGTTLRYDVVVEGSPGTTELVETDIFTDLTTAIADYQTRF